MFKNHLKIAFRQLSRNKVFSSLNILGLSIGMALAILIAMFIKSEYSYDNWMTDSDLTYRVYRTRGNNTAWTPPQLANKMMSDYPEVAAASGFFSAGEQLLTYAGTNLYVKETAYVDSTFFDVLGMDFLHGDSKSVLDQPNSMVISDQLAERIFGDKNPIGEIITYDGTTECIITGVLDKKDKKSHIITDVFTRFTWYGDYWGGNNRATYVRLKPSADPDRLADKVDKDVNKLIEQEFLARNYTPTDKDFFSWNLQPLNEIYLHSKDFTAVGENQGSMQNIYIFGLIALLVLMVAIINYVNLTTARASQRSKEVGVKKVAGAGRGLLRTQFITESVLQATLAGFIAITLAEICLPFFNKIINRDLEILMSEPLFVLIGTMALAVLTGILAGSYPAFVMAKFNPATALKSNFLKTGDKGLFRKVLVTGQFTVSITLLIVMAFIYRQVNFMMEKDLGFHPDQVLVIPMTSGQSARRVTELKAQFKQIPEVQEVTTASNFPGSFLPDWAMMIEGQTDRVSPFVLFADADFAKSLDIEMVEGRFMNAQISADSINNFVVNETFVKQYNIDHPIGKKVKFDSEDNYGQIIGVMKDFHIRGLENEIKPLVMNAHHWRNKAGIKLSTHQLPETIAALEKVWATVEPNHPMRYSFLDEEFAKQYADQQRFGKAILYATFLTVFIALLGLFGLTAFTVERRTKEIGIRKVLGASVHGIIGLLAEDFMKLLGLAFMIALPVSYLLSSRWLADFAHRTDLVWWVFLGAGLLILSAGFLTVCLQSVRAALTNPMESLRSE